MRKSLDDIDSGFDFPSCRRRAQVRIYAQEWVCFSRVLWVVLPSVVDVLRRIGVLNTLKGKAAHRAAFSTNLVG